MEHNSTDNQNMPSATLCRMGCGFYGNSQSEGMCSKCYKDAFKRRQQNSSPTQMTGRSSPLTITSSVGTPTSMADAAAALSSAAAAVNTTSAVLAATHVDTSKAPDVDTATPTVPSSSSPSHDNEQASNEDKETTEGACAGTTVSAAADDDANDKEKKPKKNRCHSCKKKIGLTGFLCRCGGMYCSMHRYSDKHSCTFNYKELAQAQIRKNNPVVVGEKIQKI